MSRRARDAEEPAPVPGEIGPLSRPVAVDRLPPGGEEVSVTATPEERAALARDFGLPEIGSLEGRFLLAGTTRRLVVTGRVRARVVQTCVVSLDPFEAEVDEEVEVDFSAAPPSHAGGAPPGSASSEDADAPDPIVDGRIDLGALTAEFLALGLDPYPRKPGVAFEEAGGEADENPFAALRSLRDDRSRD